MPRTFVYPWKDTRITERLPAHNPMTAPKTILCFSGGGIKGALEVGALYYLTQFWNDLNIVGVVGTSTGAFNAMAVAAKKQRAAATMVETYLAADEFSDFFQLTQQFMSIQIRLGSIGLKVDPISFRIDGPNIRQIAADIGADVGIVAGSAFVTLNPIATLLVAATVFKNDVSKLNVLKDVVEDLGRVRGLFTKTPILTKLQDQLGEILMGGNLLPLRMYMVRYNDGELCYMKEDGEVYDAIAHQRQRYAFANRRDRLMAGADASSAIPFFFEPVEFRIQGSQGAHLFIDGGVRENMPLVGAKEMGAERIISIVCTFADVTHASSNPSILSTMLRTLDIFQSESLINELNPPYGFNDNIQRVYIHAETKVLGPSDSFNVDPGLLRIMMDDGYMTAWEALNLDRFPDHQDEIQANRREITQLRRAIWGDRTGY